MEELLNFIEGRLTWASEHPECAKAFFHQAYGAMQFCIETGMSKKDYQVMEYKWNTTYRPSFECIIYGGAV